MLHILFHFIAYLIAASHSLFAMHALTSGAIVQLIKPGAQVQQVPSGMPPSTDLASSLAAALQSVGTLNLGGGRFILPDPQNQTFTVVSNYNAAATAFTMYAFNEDYMNATPTNNGAGGVGGGTVTKTYTDGSTVNGTAFGGNLVSRVFGAYLYNRGKICYGIDISYTNTAGQLPTALGTANVIMQYYNGDATITPLKIDISSAKRNNQFISGELTIFKKFNISRFSQFTALMPAATSSPNANTCAVIFYTSPQIGQTSGMN